MTAKTNPTPRYNTHIPPEIMTPDTVETSLGTLNFFDGVPTRETVELVYDNLDRMRGVEVFLNAMPGASVYALVKGQQSMGAAANHQVMITKELMDSNPLFLTANTSTLYAAPSITTKDDGPIVMEVPAGMLGAINDMWFRYVQDIGPAGPDRGKGGKYLILPPGYSGEVPDGYFIVRPRTYRVWIFLRASIADGVDAAVKLVQDNLRVYPLARQENPPRMEFVNGSKQPFNTIHANNFHFYEEIDDLIQEESLEMLDPETRGLLAAIGIVKGRPFAPDARMKRLLTEAVAIGNATARAIVWYPRLEEAKVYPDTDSAWVMAFAGKDVFFERAGARNLDARTMFHYAYTAVTPAMAVTRPGLGSDYAMAYLDAQKQILDGALTYKLHLPANVPVNNFWAVTIYDSQTRSLLQTGQPFPTVGSQSEGIQQNSDGSYDVYFAPVPPAGKEGNWLQTVPGKSWFAILRLYGPLEPWIDQSWRPGEIELAG